MQLSKDIDESLSSPPDEASPQAPALELVTTLRTKICYKEPLADFVLPIRAMVEVA